MFAKPCSVRKRSISSSGLIPGSSRRKTLRISSSSNTTDVFDCSAPTGRTSSSSRPRPAKPSIGANSAMPSAPCSVNPERIALHELACELRLLEAVDLQLVAAQRVQQLVDVVRAGVVAHLDERERELRIRRAQDDRSRAPASARPRATSRRTSAAASRTRSPPARRSSPLRRRPSRHLRSLACSVEPTHARHELSSFSWNQKKPRGASVNRYDSSPIAGKRVRPSISSGTIPAYSFRSSSTA